MRKAKVFMNGRSQAIRLPKEFRVAGDRVTLERVAGGILVREEDPWDAFEEGVGMLSAEFFAALEDRDKQAQKERDWTGVFE